MYQNGNFILLRPSVSVEIPRTSILSKTSDREIRVFGLHCLSGGRKHACRHGGVRSLFDQDERTRQAIGGIAVIDQRLGGLQADVTNVIHRERGGSRFGFK